MRTIGFSTGALAYSDFRRGLSILERMRIPAVELSALREDELPILVQALADIDLSQFSYVAFHAPSQLAKLSEQEAVHLLRQVAQRGIPVVLHPDIIEEFEPWAAFEELLLIENMDKRKRIGRTAHEMGALFEKLPLARLCFDLGHARQIDPSMNEAGLLLRTFGDRLKEIHISEVNTRSKHDPLTEGAIYSFQKVSRLIPEFIPIILESPVTEDRVSAEILAAEEALSTQGNLRLASA